MTKEEIVESIRFSEKNYSTRGLFALAWAIVYFSKVIDENLKNITIYSK